MKTLHANKDYVLVSGEIHFVNADFININDACTDGYTTIIFKDTCSLLGKRKIIASTDKSLPVKHIDRSLFVKPVDIINTAMDIADEYYLLADHNKTHFILGYKAGYNANLNQFTLEEMKAAMKAIYNWQFINGKRATNLNDYIRDYLMSIHPISLPKTIQCDDNYENLKPIWK